MSGDREAFAKGGAPESPVRERRRSVPRACVTTATNIDSSLAMMPQSKCDSTAATAIGCCSSRAIAQGYSHFREARELRIWIAGVSVIMTYLVEFCASAVCPFVKRRETLLLKSTADIFVDSLGKWQFAGVRKPPADGFSRRGQREGNGTSENYQSYRPGAMAKWGNM